MNEPSSTGILALDVGSSRVKLGWFPPEGACSEQPKQGALPIAPPKLREPEETLAIPNDGQIDTRAREQLNGWLVQFAGAKPRCVVGSVHPQAASAVLKVLQEQGFAQPHLLKSSELPIDVRVDRPEQVGIDRLLSAVAVNHVREPFRPAIIVGMGTACTVNLVAADGAFQGGAILPGSVISAKALYQETAALPQVSLERGETPLPVGKSTRDAIASGLYWGALGAIAEIVTRIGEPLDTPSQLFVTGGEAPRLAPMLRGPAGPAIHLPYLVLSGIWAVAKEMS